MHLQGHGGVVGLCAKDKLVELAHTAHTAGVAAARQGHTGNNSPRIAWVAQHLVQDLLAGDSGGKMLPMRTNDYLEDLRICIM